MNVCRACLQTENEMISLDYFFVTSYNLFTNLNVTKNDGLPQHSCLNCVNILKAFAEFRAKAIASETTLREIVEHTKLEALEIETKVNIKEEGYCIKQEVETEIPLVPISTDIYFSDYIDNESDNKHNLIDSNLKKLKNIKKKKSMSKKKTSKTKAQYQGTILENSLTTITKNIKRKKSKGADVGAEIVLCGLCKIKSEEESLTTHLERHKIHKQCLICFETFNSWQQLFGHRIQHLPVHDRRCHLCEKRYATSTGLEYHYLSVHGEEQEITVKCKICLKSYDTARKLRKHITSVHPTTKHIFICDYCSKRCNTKSCLKVHMATHFDIRKYTCELCEFSCKVRSGLNGHILRKHTPEKVTCQKCKRIFRNQQFHDKHKCRIENFICPVCGKEIDSSKGSRVINM